MSWACRIIDLTCWHLASISGRSLPDYGSGDTVTNTTLVNMFTDEAVNVEYKDVKIDQGDGATATVKNESTGI